MYTQTPAPGILSLPSPASIFTRLEIAEHGVVDLIERKDDIQTPLAEFELDMHWREPLSECDGKHESHCTNFVQAVLQRAECDDLLERQGPTKQEFITYLEDGLVERDFRELF